MRSSQRKGAIELSLGFIVAVVFAVVLLSLAIVWLNGIFPQIITLTDDLTQQSQSKVQETFQNTQNNFAIWPSRYDLVAGRELKMSAGIKNDADDGNNHQFVINIIPATADDRICPGGDLDSAGCSNIKSKMESWISWDKQSSVIQINRIGYRAVSVKAPNNAPKGTYIYNVIACSDIADPTPITNYADCKLNTLNWGGSAQQLTITVK